MFVQVKEKKHGHMAVQYSLYRMFTRLRNKAGAMSFNMDSSEIPMKVPPQPWTEATNGAFLLTPCKGETCSYINMRICKISASVLMSDNLKILSRNQLKLST